MPERDTTPAAALPLPDQWEFDLLRAATQRMQARHDTKVTAAAYRAAADELTAEANPHSERGAGVRWAADRLRARADQMEQQ